jgi:hypothetical protein
MAKIDLPKKPDEDLGALKRQVRQLGLEVQGLRKRLEAIETGVIKPAQPAAAVMKDAAGDPGREPVLLPAPGLEPPERAPVEWISSSALFRLVTLAGRSLIVLGGAFLLRALTDAGFLPAAGGMVAGLLYAAVWLVLADRQRAEEQRASVAFHSFTAALVAYPLLVEATVRYHTLHAGLASLLVVLFFLAGTTLAVRRATPVIGWVGAGFAVSCLLVLGIGGRDLFPPLAALLAMVTGLEWFSGVALLRPLRWLPALGLDLQFIFVILLAGRASGLPAGYSHFPPVLALAAIAAAVVVHMASVCKRAARRLPCTLTYASIQLSACLGIFHALAFSFRAPAAIPVAAGALLFLLTGIGAYLAGFATITDRHGEDGDSLFLTCGGAALAVTGMAVILRNEALSVICLVVAILFAWLARASARIIFKYQAAACLTIALLAGGSLASGVDGLYRNVHVPWHPLGWLVLAGVAASLACYALLASVRREPDSPWHDHLPELLIASWWGWGAANVACRVLSAALAQAPGSAADEGITAAVRTIVLTANVLAMAWLAKRYSLQELRWLVYPMLAFGALKLLLQDMRLGRPVTLFVALAFYGGALLAVPRIGRRGGSK